MIFLLLAACEPTVDTGKTDTSTDTADTSGGGGGADTDSGGGDTGPVDYTVVVTQVSSDYSAGTVSTIDQDGTLTDNVATFGTDPAVVADGSTIYAMSRAGESTLRRYDGLDFSAPTWEVSTGDGTNPHDVAMCGDKLFVSLYDGDAIAVYDPGDGTLVGNIDLADYADTDGSAEPDTMYVAPNGALYVSLQDYDYNYYTSTNGWVVKIDCAAYTISAEWQITPNPTILPYPGDEDKFLVETGNYYDNTTWEALYDGYLNAFDTTTDTNLGPLVGEQGHQLNFGAVVGGADGALLVGNDGNSWSIWCVDPSTWSITAAADTPTDNVYIGDAKLDPNGDAWFPMRPGYLGTSPDYNAVAQWDPSTCSPIASTATALPPYSLAVAY